MSKTHNWNMTIKNKKQTSSARIKIISLVMHFSWFLLFCFNTPTANFSALLNRQHVIWSGRKYPPLASHSFHGDHSLLYLLRKLNSKWTWGHSYKLFPNLVISHFHAEMDIGLQVCWEWREEGLQKKRDVFMVCHFTWHGMVQYGLSSVKWSQGKYTYSSLVTIWGL